MWLVKLFEYSFDTFFWAFGIYPRKAEGLTGIIFAPFIHGDFNHLISNSFPFFILSGSLFYFYRDYAFKILFFLCLMTGILIWLLARPVYHIGASGIVYGLASFLIFSGLITRNRALTALSFIIIFLYGGLLWGMFPGQKGISWESHLFGGISGFLAALWFARKIVAISNFKIEHKELWESDFSEPETGFEDITVSYDYKESLSEKKSDL